MAHQTVHFAGYEPCTLLDRASRAPRASPAAAHLPPLAQQRARRARSVIEAYYIDLLLYRGTLAEFHRAI